MAVQDLERIEAKIDRAAAGAIAVSDNVGGVMFASMSELLEFAKLMAVSQTAVPKHLRGNPGACLAVCVQALEWRMSPFSVANQSYEVNDRIAYQAMLIHAVVEARAPLKQRLRAIYSGEGTERSCKIVGHMNGEADPLEYESPPMSKIKVKNSPLWTSDVDQQLFYYASRAWARRHCPDVLLGIYAADELPDDIGPDKARDITPSLKDRLQGTKDRKGFSAAHVDETLGKETPVIEHKPSVPLDASIPPTKEKEWAAVQRSEEPGAPTLAGDPANETKSDAAYTDAEEMVRRWYAVFADPEMATMDDIDDFKARGLAAINEQPITPEQKAALLGRLNAAYLERAKKFGGKKKAAA